MIFGRHQPINKASHRAVVAFGLLLVSVGACPVAQAQSAALGDDSLLPPEVVPLDPSTASSLAAQQAATRAQTTGESQAPGLVGNGSTNNMMTTQDFRKEAFNSLYGQGQLPQNPAQMQWQSGGLSQNQMIGQNPNANMPPQGSAMNPTYAPYQQTTANAQTAQSQTLTGGTKNQPSVRDTRRSGFSNTFSALAGFGAGALAAGALMRPQNSMMGLGMFGMTMTGFGVRNGFRL